MNSNEELQVHKPSVSPIMEARNRRRDAKLKARCGPLGDLVGQGDAP